MGIRAASSALLVGLIVACGSASPTPDGAASAGAATTGGRGSAGGSEQTSRSGSAGTSSSSGGSADGGVSAITGGATSSSGGASAAGGGAAGGGVTSVGGGASAGVSASSGGASPAPSGGAGGGELPDPSAELYDPNRIPRFEIELSPDAIASLEETPDEYVRGTFRYGDQTLEDIGVRIKGEGSFRTLAKKAALKLKFDEFVDDQSFKGLRRLTLNNMVEDPSFLAERLAYYFFRALELPAPRCNSALLFVNGEAYGLYANLEAEDKTFLRRWFADDEGNLYEEGQEDFVPGAELAFDLETNEAADDRSDLVSLIELVETATPDDFLEHVGQKLDMAHFLRFTAAEAAVNQWDMYAYTVFYPNNFRLYHDPTAQRFVFLPWGMDMSMKPFRDSGKPFIELFALAREGDRPNGKVTAGRLFQLCLESSGCRAALETELELVADAYEAADLEPLAERYYEQIKPHVLADPRKEYTEAGFERGYQSLLSTIRGRAAAMRADL